MCRKGGGFSAYIGGPGGGPLGCLKLGGGALAGPGSGSLRRVSLYGKRAVTIPSSVVSVVGGCGVRPGSGCVGSDLVAMMANSLRVPGVLVGPPVVGVLELVLVPVPAVSGGWSVVEGSSPVCGGGSCVSDFT